MCKYVFEYVPVENVALLFGGFRAFFYTPLLNFLRFGDIFYQSETTNSWFEKYVPFFGVRAIGVILIGLGFELKF